mmetsp:Transcript_44796/g.139385  ORF Transcript_44796/g.139385 Transcript_44796/m.139385 type:complete len:321 (+) Transcript_44796:142-1104(+)
MPKNWLSRASRCPECLQHTYRRSASLKGRDSAGHRKQIPACGRWPLPEEWPCKAATRGKRCSRSPLASPLSSSRRSVPASAPCLAPGCHGQRGRPARGERGPSTGGRPAVGHQLGYPVASHEARVLASSLQQPRSEQAMTAAPVTSALIKSAARTSNPTTIQRLHAGPGAGSAPRGFSEGRGHHSATADAWAQDEKGRKTFSNCRPHGLRSCSNTRKTGQPPNQTAPMSWWFSGEPSDLSGDQIMDGTRWKRNETKNDDGMSRSKPTQLKGCLFTAGARFRAKLSWEAQQQQQELSHEASSSSIRPSGTAASRNDSLPVP